MPARNGTGPAGTGPMTGRGLGVCTGANAPMAGRWAGRGGGRGLGRARGMGPGFGRGVVFSSAADYTDNAAPTKETLQAQKEQLQATLAAIDKQLERW